MRITVCTTDTSAVGFYRLKQPVDVLRAAETTLDIRWVDKLPLTVDSGTRRITGFGSVDTDVLVLQIPMFSWIPDAIPELQAKGIKVVVELDDDFKSLPPRHYSYYLTNPGHSPLRNWKHLLRSCAAADLVTCSTPALAARYARHGRAAVLPNYVSRRLTGIPRNTDGLTVGWTGGTGVHPEDLQVTRGGVAAAVEECGARFVHIGAGASLKRHLNLRSDPEVSGWVDLDLYPALLARLDVGIVPLKFNLFNVAKSWIKGMEYAALGVPFVASPVQEYMRLASQWGIGRIASDRGRVWRREVKSFIQDSVRRQETSAEYREFIKTEANIEIHAWRWAEAWESVLDRRPALACSSV